MLSSYLTSARNAETGLVRMVGTGGRIARVRRRSEAGEASPAGMERLFQDVPHYPAVDIRQPEVAPLEAVVELGVVYAE